MNLISSDSVGGLLFFFSLSRQFEKLQIMKQPEISLEYSLVHFSSGRPCLHGFMPPEVYVHVHVHVGAYKNLEWNTM